MSIRAVADYSRFVLRSRPGATPPIVFPDVTGSENFSFSIWCAPSGQIPIALVNYVGTDGSGLFIGHNGFTWAFFTRDGSTGQPTWYFEDLAFDRWALICLVKSGNNIKIYYGLEDRSDPNVTTIPVVLQEVLSITNDNVFSFDHIELTSGHDYHLTNFKFWNSALTMAQLQVEAQRWDAGTAIWASTLRTPGDLSNITYPYTGIHWAEGHEYDLINAGDSLIIGDDPFYMTFNTPCPTWIYPINSAAVSSINPGQTPAVVTVYDAPQFWDMDDRGSIPNIDANIQSIEYYGWTRSSGGGIPPSDSWALYKNESGTKVENRTDRFETDTGVSVPAALKASNLYSWTYGAQFTWQARIPQIPTTTQELAVLRLFVTYIGIPTGIPHLPVQNMTGLFAINKGSHVDQYNRGTQLMIPRPTIRTAYIGK